jgi:hypothetical protein
MMDVVHIHSIGSEVPHDWRRLSHLLLLLLLLLPLVWFGLVWFGLVSCA